MTKIFLILMAVFHLQAFAHVRIPDAVCTFRGRLIEQNSQNQKDLYLEINEGTLASKKIRLTKATDKRLQHPFFLGHHVEIKLRMSDDQLSSDGQGEFISLERRVPKYNVGVYGTDSEIAEACR